MKALKERIIRDGKCFEGVILKVDNFINHQMDPILMKSMAVEFVRRFASTKINKVMTIEASGIAPANILNIAEPMNWAADWLDFWDALSEGVMMPLGALLMCLMIGWEIGPEFVKEEAEQSGHAMGSYGFFKVCVKFITPLIMVLILYGQIKEFFL